MGGCQQNIPCTKEIKSKIETQTYNINNKDIIIQDNKKQFPEDQKISSEEIKIAIPVRSFSSTKISSRNPRNKKFDNESFNKIFNKIQPLRRKSFNLAATANKTPTTQQNNNIFEVNSKNNNRINLIEMNNFGINIINHFISAKKIEENNLYNKNQLILNSLISNNANDKINKKNINDNANRNKNIKFSGKVDNNLEINRKKETKKENQNIFYENLQIEDIISEEKIHTKFNHEIVFKGNLLLVNINNEIKNVFGVMTRINLKIYKNISYFLRMKKPLFIINFHLTQNIQIIKDESLGLCFSIFDKYIFSSDSKEQLFKWIVLLNYFSFKLSE